MKLTFNSTTYGGGPVWYIDDNFIGHDVSSDRVSIKYPRSNYGKLISTYLSEKVRQYSGTLIGANNGDLRNKKREFLSQVGNQYTFTITDDYTIGGVQTTHAIYTFVGTIIDAKCNEGQISNMAKWELSIYCEDPLLYGGTPIVGNCIPDVRGFTFPMVFPLVFASSSNTITINNTGEVDVYPIVTINGSLVNLEIINQDSVLANNIFTFTGSLTSADELLLTPNPINAVKAKVNGVSVLGQTNANFEALKLKSGSNTLTFFIDSGKDAFTSAEISFYPAWKGI